jgi:hypothetical protein
MRDITKYRDVESFMGENAKLQSSRTKHRHLETMDLYQHLEKPVGSKLYKYP